MIKNPPLVSIIIPTYNSSPYILSTLRNLENQTYQNFEIIIVNDGSIDNTATLLEKESTSNPRLSIVNKKNGGVSSARNAGIKNARGECICFMDDDDKYSSDYLSRMYNRYIETNANAIYCGLTRYQNKCTSVYENIASSFAEGHILLDVLHGNVKFHIGCIFLKRSWVNEINLFFDERLRLGEDLLYIYKLLSLCSVSSVPYYMYTHMYRENSLMNSSRDIGHYEHESFAHTVIYQSMIDIYHDSHRDEVLKILSTSMLHHKIRYMWKVLLYGDFFLLKKLIHEFRKNHKNNENMLFLDSKSKKRLKLLMLNNEIVWKSIRLINRKARCD